MDIKEIKKWDNETRDKAISYCTWEEQKLLSRFKSLQYLLEEGSTSDFGANKTDILGLAAILEDSIKEMEDYIFTHSKEIDSNFSIEHDEQKADGRGA